MLLGITGFEIRYQLRNPVFWVAIAIFFLLGFGLTASENVSIGTPGASTKTRPTRSRSRPRSSPLLPVRGHRVRRQCDRARRKQRLRADRPRDLGHQHTDRGRPLPRWPDRRLARLSRDPAGDVLRLNDAMGRSRDDRPAEVLLLRLAVPDLRDSQHLPDLRAAVRAGDRCCGR